MHNWKELFAFWKNTHCLFDNFALCTNAFCTLDKYILPFGQIHFVGVTSEWDPWTCNGSISPSVAMFQLVVRLEVNYWPFRPVDGRIWGLYWAPDSQIHLLTNCSFQNIGMEKILHLYSACNVITLLCALLWSHVNFVKSITKYQEIHTACWSAGDLYQYLILHCMCKSPGPLFVFFRKRKTKC